MEELIFFAVIIFFSIIESIARSRKAKRGGGSEEPKLPDLPSPAEMERDWRDEHVGPMRDTIPKTRETLPTYDQDPSYDDAASAGARGGVTTAGRGGGMSSSSQKRRESGAATRPSQNRGEAGSESMRPSSETMLPGGLFEELAELAGQLERSKARPIKLPKQSPPLPGSIRRPLPAKVAPAPVEHMVHRAHIGYGTDPSSRIASEQDGLDPLATFLSEDAKAVRMQLRSKNPSELRRAFVLHEVFGPPVALREGPT